MNQILFVAGLRKRAAIMAVGASTSQAVSIKIAKSE